MRDFQSNGRSPVYATRAAAATSHPLASLVAIELLKTGGNAVDAAIAAAAMLCVVEPHMTGVGGDCFALYAPSGAPRPIAINGSGRAPAAADLDWYLSRGYSEIPDHGPHAVVVPGAVAAWCRLHADYGRRPLDEVLAPAIRYAEEGYAVSPRVAADWAAAEARLRADAGSRRLFLIEGRAPRVGERHRQPQLAATLQRIASEGAAGFYQGPVAADIVARLRELGGLHTEVDFAATQADYVDPIASDYRGYQVWQCPPNGQGVIALLILNQLAGFDLADPAMTEVERLHLLAEATKQAYRQRDLLLADMPDLPIALEELLSQDFAERLRDGIDPQRSGAASFRGEREHRDTVYLCVVDEEGNAISFINSLFDAFGSTIAAPGCGVILNNRASAFRLAKGHPNAIGSGKRPMHTIIPGMLYHRGHAVMPFGVMGGHYQACGHAHLLMRLLDLGLDVQAALEAPRLFAIDGRLELETGIRDAIAEELTRRGHGVTRRATPLGGGQAIWMDGTQGVLIAGSDPRKDGCALGY